MNELINDFLGFLDDELNYLTGVSNFLETIPKLITENRIKEYEFGNFLEKYELELYRIASKKKSFFMRLAHYYNIDVVELNLSYLIKMGHKEFIDTGRNIIKLSNRIKLLLLKVSIYLEKFKQLNTNMKTLNKFLFQNNYASDGIENRGQSKSIFSSEA